MIPGGMRNQRQMQMAMRRLGMTTEEVEGVEEVVIRTKDKEHVFSAPEVTILQVQGVRTYQ
ncbi:MAG TPA: NAC domain-containing protein, partial [Thermoplasmata archaeon]|nr:NAC domain-containing protein [Thermoplasmata archaeon]